MGTPDREVTWPSCGRCWRALVVVKETLVCPPCTEDRTSFRNAYVAARFDAASKVLRPGDGEATGFGPIDGGDAWWLLDQGLAPRGLVIRGDETGWRVVRLERKGT